MKLRKKIKLSNKIEREIIKKNKYFGNKAEDVKNKKAK